LKCLSRTRHWLERTAENALDLLRLRRKVLSTERLVGLESVQINYANELGFIVLPLKL
jgi:hypothetical protein